MPMRKDKNYDYDNLISFFHFIEEEKGGMNPYDIRLLLEGFMILFSQNLMNLSPGEIESIIHEIDDAEEWLARHEKVEERVTKEPLSAFELFRIPRTIREEMKRGGFAQERFKTLVSQFEGEIEKSSSKITLSQSFQLRQEIAKLKEEFATH